MGTFCCKAQSLSSIEELYIDQKSEDAVVVCINPSDNNSTIISYNDSLDYRPNFVYHTHTGTGVSKRFHILSLKIFIPIYCYGIIIP